MPHSTFTKIGTIMKSPAFAEQFMPVMPVLDGHHLIGSTEAFDEETARSIVNDLMVDGYDPQSLLAVLDRAKAIAVSAFGGDIR